MPERMFAVAVRDGDDLFLWIRIRRAVDVDLYYVFPTGRQGPDWKKWNPHGSLHKDGRLHHKSFDRKLSLKKGQKPDSNFKGTENWITRPIASNEPRAVGVLCDRAEFSEVIEVPIGLISPKKYETYILVNQKPTNGTY